MRWKDVILTPVCLDSASPGWDWSRRRPRCECWRRRRPRSGSWTRRRRRGWIGGEGGAGLRAGGDGGVGVGGDCGGGVGGAGSGGVGGGGTTLAPWFEETDGGSVWRRCRDRWRRRGGGGGGVCGIGRRPERCVRVLGGRPCPTSIGGTRMGIGVAVGAEGRLVLIPMINGRACSLCCCIIACSETLARS